jgi:hypothetical protein
MKEQLGQPCFQPGPSMIVLDQELAAALEEVGKLAGARGGLRRT